MGEARLDIPAPGAVAWLDVSPQLVPGGVRQRTGPLGLQIHWLRNTRALSSFRGARLRGTRCIWSASTVSGAELRRAPNAVVPAPFEGAVQLLARVDAGGSVFEHPGGGSGGTLRVVDPTDEIIEQCHANTHLFTLTAPMSALGVEPAALEDMYGQEYELTILQTHLLRASVGLLLVGADELATTSSLVGVDRHLAALAGLLLRIAVPRQTAGLAQIEQLRLRVDAIVYEQATDPSLTPATIAAQLNISLRQLYRAFSGTESPAARIRRRRLEHAAEIIAARSGPGHVERVAFECGFTSPEYFSRAFRREFGLSPRAYRSRYRDRPSG